jgi:hypothetical protein
MRLRALPLALAGLLAQSGPGPLIRPADGFEPQGRLALSERDHEFAFARAAYSDWGGRWRPSWATDYPKADRQFLIGLKRLTRVDAYDLEHPVRLDDPELRRFPFLYAVEVGRMSLTEEEVLGLRRYLQAGGLLVVDDFWGTWEWETFQEQISRVLPGRPVVDLPPDHPLFRIFFEIDELLQVPNVQNGMAGGPTWERDGYLPHCRGIFDDDGELMVVINWNTDLGDAWEWAENPYYPLQRSTFAYQLGVNLVLYSMTH